MTFPRVRAAGFAKIKIAPAFPPARSPSRFVRSISKARSGFSFLGVRGLFALCFELSELLRGKNSFRLFEERSPTLLCAACLHAFGLPRFDFCLLIGCEIQCGQINACRFIRVRHAFDATRPVSRERAGCNEHRGRNQSCSGKFDHDEW